MNFGNKLRGLIEERSMTQKELATQLNIAPSTMGSYVQNTREPDFSTLKLLAKYFSVSTDYLLNVHTDKTASYTEDELLRVFRSMKPEQQEMYVEQGKAVVRLNQKENVKSS